jgi:hypothetical protein
MVVGSGPDLGPRTVRSGWGVWYFWIDYLAADPEAWLINRHPSHALRRIRWCTLYLLNLWPISMSLVTMIRIEEDDKGARLLQT